MSGSTSNLGPGFDLLGLALSLSLRASVVGRSEEGPVLRSRAGEARTWPDGSEDLLLRAFERAQRELGGDGAWVLEATSEIPVGRGLGSSAAAIAAGLLLGEALAPRRAGRERLLGWAVEIEGHPDNVAPALFGGCVISAPRAEGPPRIVRIELHPSLGFAVAWPEARLETRFARSLLPREVPLADAVENARRLALLLEGLRSGEPELLALGVEDRLHVPYRLPHIPGGAAALEAARAAGSLCATISGSGTALFAIAPHERAQAAADAMASAFRAATGHGTGRVVHPVLQAP
ncbi:MAG TPA: homoserine kinase, partial [Planctomycetota bacterium]|nr:homoserine kinase [Planctomycetota bacterium]